MLSPHEHHQLKYPPILGMEIEASRLASSIAAKRRMSPDKVDEVSMAVVEAFLNALEHNHSKDGVITLTVDVLGDSGHETLQITVRDTGAGFSAGQAGLAQSCKKLTPLQKRGWGLKLIERLMDETRITSDGQGTTITMSKHCH